MVAEEIVRIENRITTYAAKAKHAKTSQKYSQNESIACSVHETTASELRSPFCYRSARGTRRFTESTNPGGIHTEKGADPTGTRTNPLARHQRAQAAALLRRLDR